VAPSVQVSRLTADNTCSAAAPSGLSFIHFTCGLGATEFVFILPYLRVRVDMWFLKRGFSRQSGWWRSIVSGLVSFCSVRRVTTSCPRQTTLTYLQTGDPWINRRTAMPTYFIDTEHRRWFLRPCQGGQNVPTSLLHVKSAQIAT